MTNLSYYDKSTRTYTGDETSEIISTFTLGQSHPSPRGFTIYGRGGDDTILSTATDGQVNFLSGDDGNDFFGVSAVYSDFASTVIIGGSGTDTVYLQGLSSTPLFTRVRDTITEFEVYDPTTNSRLSVGVSDLTEIITWSDISGNSVYYLTEDIASGRIRSVDWNEAFARTYGPNSDWAVKGLDTYSQYHQQGAVIEGTASADTLSGTKWKDQLKGLGGSDTIFGDAGDDLIKGGAGKDYLGGGEGNDTIDGNQGSDFIVGGEGSDTLRGGSGGDILVGIELDNTNYGKGTVDQLTGGGGRDQFTLGYFGVGCFYRDESTFTSGTSDYAWITDFEDGDTILLAGRASDYLLARSNIGGIEALSLYLDDGTGSTSTPGKLDESDELIAFIQGSIAGLSLDDTNRFIYG